MAVPEKAYSRKEMYYAGIAKGTEVPEKPYTREEMYLDGIKDTVDYIKEEVDKKSESIPLEYKNNKIYKDGAEIDFEGIKALMGDHTNDIDLHADNDTIMRITAFADDAIEFSTTYITGGKVYVDRVIINSDNDIKFDEIETGGGGELYDTVYGTNADGSPTQKAVVDDLFGGNATGNKTTIGKKAKVNSTNYYHGVAIGNASATGSGAIAIGSNIYTGDLSAAKAEYPGAVAIGILPVAGREQSIAIGTYATTSASSSVAIGYNSKATVKGEFNIGSSGTYGYNNTPYRLLTGLHDPVNDHDAATKAYVDSKSNYVRLTNNEETLLHNGTPITFAELSTLIDGGAFVELYGQPTVAKHPALDQLVMRMTCYIPNTSIMFTGFYTTDTAAERAGSLEVVTVFFTPDNTFNVNGTMLVGTPE